MDAYRFAITKIQPPRMRATRIARPGLDDALARALLERRVVVLQAAAGFGKTSALAAQIPRLPAGTALAWVSLDEDDDRRRLFACLTAALEPFDLPWRIAPEGLLSRLDENENGQAAQDEGGRLAAAELLNALAAAEVDRGVIVLDDLHRVASAGLHRWLDRLVERLPAQWTLVLASRAPPPLALARQRAAGELAEFSQDTLRFSRSEAAALLAADGGDGTGVDALFDRTQGWPAGLQLVAAARRRPGGATSSGNARVDPALFDFLASEVLDDLPQPLHDFLLRSAVLPELTVARAEAVSGDIAAAAHLDEIERRGLFVTVLDAAERTLVLHDLFRDALQQRLRQRFPDELTPLLQRAAAGETDPLRRVGTLLRAADWAGAEGVLVESAPDLFLAGGAGEALRLVEQFPPAWRSRAPRLLRLAGVACCLRWQWESMTEWCEAAVAAARATGDELERRLAQAYLASALYAVDRNPEAEALLAALHNEPLAPEARLLTLLADCTQHFRRGEHVRLRELFTELMAGLEREASLLLWWECAPAVNWSTLQGLPPLIERYASGALARIGARPLPLRAELLLQQAFGQLWAGRLDVAREAVHAAEDDMRWLACSGETEIGVQLFRLIEGAICGHADDVRQRLQALFEREQGGGPTRLRLWRHQIAVYGVRMNDALAAPAETLRHWAGFLFERPLEDPGPATPRAIAARARFACAQGRWADAAALFEQLQPRLAGMDVMGQRIELQLRSAHALLQLGRLDAAALPAAAALARVVSEPLPGPALLCGPARLRALADADWGQRLAPALRQALHELAARAAAANSAVGAAGDVPGAAPAAGRDDAAARLGPLSPREFEVLERIAAGDSNKLIARALDISPHTVKRHIANILDKLGLSTRGQASHWLHGRVREPATGA